MRKAIVTGANGFIGTAVCRELSAQGVEIIAVIRNEEEHVEDISSLKGLRIVYCDLTNFRNLHTVIPDRDVDILYHLAWVGSAGPLRGDDAVQLRNVQYTCDTVRACAEIGCGRFVFASSIMEYEIAAAMETEATAGINTLYCSAKITANYMARALANSLGIRYIRALISNIYGPGERSPRLVNSSIRKLLVGEHCAFSPGEQMYDFIYIADAARYFVAIGEKGHNNRTYYIGSRNPRPLKEFLLEMAEEVAPGTQIGLGEIPFSGTSLTYQEFNINAVYNDCGIEPITGFREGIRNTAEWIKSEG